MPTYRIRTLSPMARLLPDRVPVFTSGMIRFLSGDPNANDFALPELTLRNNLSLDRLADRRGLQSLIDRQAGILESSAEARVWMRCIKNHCPCCRRPS